MICYSRGLSALRAGKRVAECADGAVVLVHGPAVVAVCHRPFAVAVVGGVGGEDEQGCSGQPMCSRETRAITPSRVMPGSSELSDGSSTAGSSESQGCQRTTIRTVATVAAAMKEAARRGRGGMAGGV